MLKKFSPEFVLRAIFVAFLGGAALMAWVGYSGMLDAHQAALTALRRAEPGLAQQFAADAASRESTALWLLGAMLAAGAGMAVFFRWWIVSINGAPLRITLRILHRVAEGDLVSRVDATEFRHI